MKGKVTCTCGWSWNKSDSSKKDMYICHECGRDNSNNMKNGGWMDNYNDSKASAPEGMVGDGFSNVGRDYSPAWGGQFEEGGEIPMAQNGTRADSLALYNNALNKIKFYKDNPDYVQLSPSMTNFKSDEVRKNLIKLNKNVRDKKIKKLYVDDIIKNAEDDNKPLTPAEKSAIKKQSNIIKFGPVRGTNLTSFGDVLEGEADTYYNPLSPPIYLHPNISPQGSERYYSERFGDRTDIPYYDPTAVAPFDVIKNNPKLVAERIKKYGTKGIPKSYLDKLKSEGNLNKQRPKVEALQPLTKQGVVSDFSIDAELPVIRPEARMPKSFDVNSQRQTMSGPSEYYDYSGEGVDINDAIRAKESADAYNQYIQEKYKEAAKSNPKAQKRLEQLMQNVELTPNFQMGGNVYPVNYVPQAQEGEKIENRIDNFLGNPQEKARDKSRIFFDEDPIDNLRHAFAGRYTQDAISKKLGNGIVGNIAGLIGSNAMGAAHEISTLLKDKRNLSTKLRESGEDMFNNAFGSIVGALPYMDSKAKDELMFKMAKGNLLPDGYVSTPEGIKKGLSNNVYFKNEKGKIERKYEMGGSIPGSVGFTYARTKGIPSEGPYAKKTLPSAQDGVDMYDNPLIARRVDNPNINRSYYDPRLNTMNMGSDYNMWRDEETGEPLTGDDLKYQQDKMLAHENYHAIQHKEGRDNYDIAHSTDNEQWARMQKRPEVMSTDAVWNNFYNRSAIENIQDYANKINEVPEARLINQQLLFDKVLDRERYDNPSNLEGEAKFYEDTGVKFQNGGEMRYYQNGLDWKPKTIDGYEEGGVIKDDRGQWEHPGEVTEINSPYITMQGVPYPVLGISDTGDTQMMYPEEEYEFDGEKVTEFPMAKNGLRQEQKGLVNLDNLLNFTNYNNLESNGWLDKYEDGGTIPPVMTKQVEPKKEIPFEKIPTTDNKKIVIDNFSPSYDYIVEGDKTYYKVKGGNSWADISNNTKARKNLLEFLDKNNYWAGYGSGEKDKFDKVKNQPVIVPGGKVPKATPTIVRNTETGNKPVIVKRPIQKVIKEEPGFFDDISDFVSSEVDSLEKKWGDVKQEAKTVAKKVGDAVTSGIDNAITTTEDAYHTVMNGIQRKYKTHTGDDDDAEVKTSVNENPKTVKEWYGNKSGAEITQVLDAPNVPGRTYKQQVLPTSNIRFGVRNRGEYKDIKTDGLEVTTFQPFTKNALPDNSSVLAIDANGNLHTGQYKDFKGKKDYMFSTTFRNKIIDFPEVNGKGEYVSGAKSGNPKYQQPKVKVLDDNGKVVNGSLNILVKDDSKKDYYGQVQGGRILFVNPTTKEQYLVSGSMNHIKQKFKELKGNNKYLEAYTLDNGTYSRGLSYKDKKLTKDRLKSYDLENTSGGNGLYIIDYKQPVSKYSEDYIDNMPNVRTKNDESYKKGHPLKNEIKNIVLHHTAYTGPNAEKELNKQYMTPGKSSSHIVIQENGKRSIYASPEQVTFHAGESEWNKRKDVNDFSIGVEFQGDTNKKPLTQAQIESFVEYYEPLAKKYNLSLKDIITHQMIAPGRKPDISEKQYARILKYMRDKNFK